MMEELLAKLNEIAEDPEILGVLITGEGQRVFSAGVEVADHSAERMEEAGDVFYQLLSRMRSFPLPLVAGLNGAAVGGGCELALACDMIISTPEAKIGQPEITLAAMAAPSIFLMQGRLHANIIAEMLLSGDTFNAERGYQLGLVNQLVSREHFLADCTKFMERFTRMSRPVLAIVKEALNRAHGKIYEDNIDWMHRLYVEKLLPLQDSAEGIEAFAEKRTPRWSHR